MRWQLCLMLGWRVQGVRRVRFRVAAAGSNACAHAVWLEPTLVA